MTTIAFTGDIAFSQCFKDAWRGPAADEATVAFLRRADHVVADIEGPVTDRAFVSERGLNHASPPGAADVLRSMGVDVWDLANNHILDCGEGGADDTLAAARAGGAIPLGLSAAPGQAPEPVILGQECRVGLLSVADDWPFLRDGRLTLLDDGQTIRRQLSALRGRADYIVLVIHAGREYAGMPLPPERRLYKRLLRWGADVIVAHHPHVVQNYERVGDKLIFYSLGNFIFDTPTQRQFRHTDGGVLLRLTFSGRGIGWTYLPVRIDRQRQLVRADRTAPAVFRTVSRWDYALLWPLAAAVYRRNARKKSKLFCAGQPAVSGARRLLQRVKALGDENARMMLAGRILARLGLWRLSRRKQLAAYLLAGASDVEEESGS